MVTRPVAPRAWPEARPFEPARPRAASPPPPPPDSAGWREDRGEAREATPTAPADALEDARLAARELEATKGRLEREQARVLAEQRASVVGEMLPVLDNLDRSIDAGIRSGDPALLEGVKLVRQQFEDALARCGLERVPSEGLAFDPRLHEAVATAPVDDPDLDGVVLSELARGYRLEGRLVRPALVRVGKLEAA